MDLNANTAATSRICIIGGGAAGLAVLKVLLESEEYKAGIWDLTLFEAREQIGGVWLPSPPNLDPPASPLYDDLTTNLPHPVMAFQSFWFPPATPLFPHASVVLTYLQAFSERFNLLKFITFNTRVEEALWHEEFWEVRISSGTTHLFDKVIVANGHFNVPRYPMIPGLQSWIDSGVVSHSMYYRSPRSYQGMRVLIIGGGPSGQDISAAVCTVAAIVYHSVKGTLSEDVGNLKRRAQVLRFDESGEVVFEDGSVASNIDRVILATGYAMSIPFLPQIRQEATLQISPLPSHAINTTFSIFPLARQLFPIQDDFPIDTLAFVGLPIRVVPFPLFEAQGRLITKVFRKPGYLDRKKEEILVAERYDHLKQKVDKGSISSIVHWWHILAGLEHFSYRREILELAGAGGNWEPEDWAEEMYCAKGQLRAAWVELEKNGQAAEWVKGVGEGGRHEWVLMMRRLLYHDATSASKL